MCSEYIIIQLQSAVQGIKPDLHKSVSRAVVKEREGRPELEFLHASFFVLKL